MSRDLDNANRLGVQLWADAKTRSQAPVALSPLLDSQLVRTAEGFQMVLPQLTPGDMVVPSFSALSSRPWHFQCTLNDVALPMVPSPASSTSEPSTVNHGSLATHLDWFETLTPLSGAILKVSASQGALTARHMLSVSIRPVHQATADTKVTAASAADSLPGISQRQAATDIRGRICSPTAVAMVLAHHGYDSDWLKLVSACRDPATGMYGLWPLCVMRAAEAGSLGAVRTFSTWKEVTPLLAAGFPIVASIRYPAGALPGSPMPSTAGHLVVVYGVDDDWVLVNDPAAPDHKDVPRRYPRIAFERAWFDHRGAGYLLLPP